MHRTSTTPKGVNNSLPRSIFDYRRESSLLMPREIVLAGTAGSLLR